MTRDERYWVADLVVAAMGVERCLPEALKPDTGAMWDRNLAFWAASAWHAARVLFPELREGGNDV